jgi:methyl-accepting chemotaxis protein
MHVARALLSIITTIQITTGGEMKKRSLSTKLMTGGIILVLVPIVIIGIVAVSKTSKSLQSISRESAVTVADDLSKMTQLALAEEVKAVKHLSVSSSVVAALAKASEVGSDDASEELNALGEMLRRIREESDGAYEGVVALDVNGVVIADWAGNTGIDLGERGYFKAAKAGRASVSNVVRSKSTGKAIAPVCAPVMSSSGEFLGAVAFVTDIDFIASIITSVQIGESGYAFMVDQDGVVIAHQNEELVLNAALGDQAGMKALMSRVLAGETGVESYTYQGMEKISGFGQVSLTGWSIITTQPTKEFLAPVYHLRNLTLIIGIVFLVITVLIVFIFVRGISIPINRIIQHLDEGADQVAEASGEIANAGQSLASGASEQAAAIEETSSSLEEMSAMTKQNADNANMANGLMNETNKVVKETNDSMAELTQSMKEISAASEETSKIIKTIDEIAFQTNLLALNAAVEAARAGEAGAGFAVVADEVRNLAMRAAEAAKNTAKLIEDTVGKITHGSEIVNKADENFGQVAENASKVEGLVAELSAASNEQAQGIGQINQAVAEMDKVVQMNAANAEESASAGEEMNAQAVQMKSMVDELVVLIQGGEQNGDIYRRQVAPKSDAARYEPRKKMPAFQRKAAPGRGKEVRPDAVIPMSVDDSDFDSF